MVVLWSGAFAGGAACSSALVERGFVVAVLEGAPTKERLAGVTTHLRRRFRIAQGGMHALVADTGEAALAALLAQRHEFQTVTVFAAAKDAGLEAVRKLPKRRVHALATVDPAEVATHVHALHDARELSGVAGQVARALDSFHDAAAVADEDRYFAILPDDAVFLGTDATERWTGKQFRDFAMRYFQRDSAWTYNALARAVTVGPGGQLAWFDETLDNSSYGECRGTGVLQLRDGRWVLRQYNLTVPVPNDLMRDVTRQIRKHLFATAR